MAFLDNSGDIILEAVLTDTGRMRLAKGDGSFRITSFALADDEIDYSLYINTTGSAYQDLQILQTPVFEAFTNNASSMKSKLISIADPKLLYLPVIQLNEIYSGNSTQKHADGVFVVAVNSDTENKFNTDKIVMYGETQYAIEIDNRFGTIVASDGTTSRPYSFVDDDDIATYYYSLATDPQFVTENSETSVSVNTQVISGPRGTILQFKVASSIDLIDGSYFDDLGSTKTITDDFGGTDQTSTYKYIDTFVRVQGMTTGYSLDVPVRFIRFQTD